MLHHILWTGENPPAALSTVIDTLVRFNAKAFEFLNTFGGCQILTCVSVNLARALHRILEWKNHGVKWRHHEMHRLDVLNMIVKRINEASVSFAAR